MYLLKIKGSNRIPDYIQIRDEDFTLVAYFRFDRSEYGLKKNGFLKNTDAILEVIKTLPYGKIKKIM